MKKLVTLIALSWTALASAQTAGQYIAAGTNDLTLTNWWGADTNFTAALAVSPANEDANVLKAVTRLLVLPQTPAGSNFLVALGFPKTNRWLFGVSETGLPSTNGFPILPANYNSATIVSFFRTNILTAITNSAANLAVITDPNYTLSLSSNETFIESVTVDYGDIQMLRALLSAAQFFGYTLNENNLSVVVPQVESWMETNGFTYQLALGTYTSILALQNTSDLPASESALTNAIANYFAASAFIRNRPVNATNRLFELDAGKTDEEATFRTLLTNVLASLNGPAELSPNNADAIESTLNLNAWFSGVNSLNSFLPKFNGDVYVNDSLLNYTFGGIVPDWPAYKTENFLRKEFYSYAGIYIGDNGQYYDGNPALSDNQGYQNGSFAVFVGTNQQATLMGHDDGDGAGDNNFGFIAQFTVNKGNWQFSSNNVSGYGYIGKDGSINGELDYTNGVSVYLNGEQQSPAGLFQNLAGFYSGGTYSASEGGNQSSGSVQAIVAADGELFYLPIQTSPSKSVGSGGGPAQLNANDQFTYTQVSGSIVSGTINSTNFSISGILSGNISGSFNSLTRSAKVPFDVPPVITTDLPLSINVALGTNVTFSLTATGSPPLSYQWFFNSNAIPGATASTLVVSNNLWTSTGTYYISASVTNVVGGTNSQLCTVTVTTETTPPTLAITSPVPGQLWSNATFTVTGTASDKVAVAGVYWSLSNAVVNSSFAPAMTANNWANWSTNVTLAPGTNTVRAYAVNTGGIPSTTNSATFVYILSAPLTVQLTGKGTITPNYSNAVLQVGANYTVTAGVVSGSGFAFTNWTGGTNLPLTVLTNGPILQFVMASNLVLQANFVDTNRPVISITNVTAGMQISNANFIVKGTATDNVAVASVYFQLNTSGWSSATSFNGTNWTAAVTLAPGTNTIAAYAVDTSGNVSVTNTVKFDYVVSAPLTVQLTGKGTITPNYSNAVLQVGVNYTVTAGVVSGSGFAFTNWTGGTNLPLTVLTNGPILQFVMASNLVLQANFVETNRPTLTITAPTAGQHMTNALATVVGTASDSWKVTGVWYQLNGGTTWNQPATTNGWTNWTTTVELQNATNTIKAYALNLGGNFSTTNNVSFVSSNAFKLLLAFTVAQPLATNGLNFALQLSPGLNGHVQVSTDLVDWVALTNFVGTNATLNFRDAAATNFNNRFYRAVSP